MSSTHIFPCAFASSLARLHLPLYTRIYPLAYLSWLSIVAQSSLSHLAIHLWANLIAGLRSRSTLGQTSSQDFARDPPLGKPHCRTSLTIHPLANLIAGLCSQSTLGQTSSQDFARDPPLGKHHRRTSLAIHPWANLIAGLRSRSTLGQTSSQNSARDPPLVNLICP